MVDDDSEDDTAAIVDACAKHMPNVRLLGVGSAFPEMAAKKRPMSVGIHHARGEWIATTDADCQAPPTWLSGLSAYMHPDVGAIIGFSHLSTDQRGLFQRLQALDFLALMAAAAGAAGLGIPLAASGQNLSYRKALFNQVGGFRAIAHRPSGDDVLLLQLLRRAWPGRIVFADDPGAFVSTHRAETPASFWRQRRRWASNAAYQLTLNPAFFAYIGVVFLLNVLILAGLFFSTGPALMCYLAKTLCDLLVIVAGARRFSRTDLLSALPLWLLLQPPYTLLVGLFGTLGGFSWKGRRHG